MPDPQLNIPHADSSDPRAEAEPSARQLTLSEFGTLLAASRKPLWSIAAAVLSDRTAADDCVQDAAAIGLSKLDEFDPETNFSAWMGQIVRFVALNELRKRVRSKVANTDPEILAATIAAAPANDPSPIDRAGRFSTDQSAFDDRTQAALRSLDETPRICLLLRTIHSMPYDEISSILGIPEGTAMSHVHRARGALRERLGGGMAQSVHTRHKSDANDGGRP